MSVGIYRMQDPHNKSVGREVVPRSTALNPTTVTMCQAASSLAHMWDRDSRAAHQPSGVLGVQPLLGHTVLHLHGSTVMSDRTYRGSTIARGQSDLEERTERNGGGQELAEAMLNGADG